MTHRVGQAPHCPPMAPGLVQTFLSLIAEERIQRGLDGGDAELKSLVYVLFALCIFLEYVFCLYFYLLYVCFASIKNNLIE